ncbi:hypothetical protein M406DRAFT_259097 [Cryphonectria parasitica EP155]|uniref:Nudix hydrolase domain-containing protein n=1 Tax=Cryphonectria parasitica (strain ATCC 38755 / EP155) TaxID=660469 RepID=A0A9P4Y0G5_CRYP1|nr:uncharacterized protein M406DRAFT_259097 [Cryphonectria parasitica EP155]KAF3764127.1 hypothetical protein M406DRAFT_259097 [Cryphonectria parasitica EP155]
MSSTTKSNPRVGVAAVIRGPDGRVILGRRMGSHGAGQWAFPGGHLENGESLLECAERETLEETGLSVKGVKIANVTNDVFTELGTHYVTLFVLCELSDPQQQPQLLEPDKCEGWVWVHLDDLHQYKTEELFLPIQNLLKQSPNLDHLFPGLPSTS